MNNQSVNRSHKKKKTRLKPGAAIALVVLLAVVCVAVALLLHKSPAVDLLTDSSASPSSESTTQTSDESISEPASSTDTSIENVITTTEPSNDVTTEPTESEPVPTSELTTAPHPDELVTSVNPDTGRIVVDVNREDWNLIVVNAGRELPEGYTPQLKEILGCGKYLDYRVAPYYEQMYLAAKADGIILTPYSAYRSYDRQKNNYNNLTKSYMSQYNLNEADARVKAATVILPPGTSEHNLGYAMDICGTESSFSSTKEYAWLQQHAHEYGFILRYTAEKQPITGIIPEPWHWRYVGVEYAEKIKNSGLCLEEYLDSIGVPY